MQSFLVQLPGMQTVSVSGQQRDDYLHGQVTVDTKSFVPGAARIGAHCDFKGKMWSIFVLTRFQDSYHMVMTAASAQESLTQLKKYGVFSKVNIDLLDPSWHIFGGAGEQLKHDLHVLFPDITDRHLSHCANEFGEVVTFNDDNLRYLILLRGKGCERLKEMAEDYLSDRVELWNMSEISAGMAYIEAETIGEFVPQMFNLQAVNGIDFDKGCYMGQEVIARTKFLGRNKRALYVLEANEALDRVILSGQILEKSVGEHWRSGGTVIRCAVSGTTTKILAVLANDTEVSDVLRLKGTNEAFSVLPMPYSLDSEVTPTGH